MKYIRAMLAVVCLLVVGGAIGAARAEDDEGVILYTPINIGDFHRCTAVNVSDKTLGITLELLSRRGPAVSCASPNACLDEVDMPTTNPTPELHVLKGTGVRLGIIIPTGTAANWYCAVAVSGTANRDDVRVSLITHVTTTIPGTTIPVLLTRVVEGH